MFENHTIIKKEDEQSLYLYLNHNYEFASYNTVNEVDHDIYYQVKDYMEKNNIHYDGNKIYLVSNGIVFGVLLHKNDFNKYIEFTDVFHS